MRITSLTRLLSLTFICVVYFSFNSSHPTGRSGAPGDGLCSNCHGGFSSIEGDINLSGLPATLTPGQSYDIEIDAVATAGNPVCAGFQVVSLLGSNNNQAGQWSNAGAFSSFRTSGGRVYFGHRPSQNFNGGDIVSWEAQWQAPDVEDEVTFYMVALLANGNGSSSGDETVVKQLSYSVASLDPLLVNIVDVEDVLCAGDNNGSATAQASGGTSPYSYLWSNGETNERADALSGGLQSVTVTDTEGNTASAQVTIGEAEALQLSVSVEPEDGNSSNGAAFVSVEGGTAPYNFSWSTGQMEQSMGMASLTMLEAGDYQVTVTDDNDCISEISFQVPGIPCNFTADAIVTDLDCFGEASGEILVETTNAVMPVNFAWSDGSTDTMRQNLPAGNYSVTLTDALLCTDTLRNIVVAQPDSIYLDSLTITNNSCGMDGMGAIAFLVKGGEPPYNLLWSNGVGNDTIINNMDTLVNLPDTLTQLLAGSYSLTISDNNNCIYLDSFNIISQDDGIDATIFVEDVLCAGENQGIVNIEIAGDNGQYIVNYLGGYDPQALGVGNYQVEVINTDNGCSRIFSFDISEPAPLAIELSSFETDACTGAFLNAELNYSGGTMPYSENTNVTDEFVSFTVTDANACTQELRVLLDDITDSLKIVSFEIVNASGGSSDGAIMVEIEGGLMPYEFSWFDSLDALVSTDQNLANVPAGLYRLEVIDGRFCEAGTELLEIETISSVLDNSSEDEIEIYPNPVSDVLTINTGFRPEAMTVYDMSGSVMAQYDNMGVGTTEIDMRNYTPGVYLLVLAFRNKILSYKVVRL